MFTPWNAFTYSTGAFVFLFNWGFEQKSVKVHFLSAAVHALSA